MGVEGLIKMVETFEFDKRSGVDLPNEKVSHTPKYYKPYVEKRDGKWNDIETVFASIGQVTVDVTPISMLRAVSIVGVQGKMFVPHLLKEFKPISAIGEEGDSNFIPSRPGFVYSHSAPKIIEMTPEQNKVMVQGMWGVVNGGGTGAGIKINGFDIAGKTGTAQVAKLGQDVGAKKDHSWFVSFAPAYKPELAVIALIENSGFGGSHAAPAVKGVYEAYITKHHSDLLSEQEIAKK
jgi:penicillin-binding protein 2